MIDRHLRRQLRRPHRWAARRLRPRGAVLMYHGIGRVGIDPWGLFVSEAHFAQHLRVLSELTRPMPLERLAETTASGELASRSVAVTFDDGYANVAERAAPLLADHAIPATLFVVSEPLASPAEYWWDELAGLVLVPGQLPDRLDINGPGYHVHLSTGAAAHYELDQWHDDHAYRDEEGPASPRMALYRTLWSRLSPLGHDTRQHVITELARWAGRDRAVRDSHRSLTVDELVALDGATITIGGHTSTHPLLPEIDAIDRRAEIEEDKRRLAGLLGRPVTAFSYPFGANDPATVDAVRAADYRLAVTTRPETASAGADPFRIGRFDVKDWDGDEFERRLRNWLRFR